MDNKSQWRFFTKVVQCLLDTGGIVFGGAVRDIYARDNNAKMFYEKVGYENANEFYLDEDYHTEFKDRKMIPKDLDASIHHTKVKSFLDLLYKNNLNIHILYKRDAKTYLPNINVETGEVTHWCISVRPHMFVKLDKPSFMTDLLKDEFEAIMVKINKLKQDISPIFIDLLVNQTDRDIDPPFGDLDFECNGLVLTQDGIRLSRCLHDKWYNRTYPLELDSKLERIKKDILRKYAVPITQQITSKMAYRTAKMVNKGYKIHMQDIITIHCKEEEQHSCILCHEDLNEDNKHYKLPCCEARYHEKCLVLTAFKGITAITRTQSCIMCRQRVPEPTRNELDLLRCVYVATADKADIPPEIDLVEEEVFLYPLRRPGFHPPTPTRQENRINYIRRTIPVIEDTASSNPSVHGRRISDID